MTLVEPFLDITFYESGLEKRLKYLKTQVEKATAIFDSVEPRVLVYLIGSMARKLLGGKERSLSKVFYERSDADLLIVLKDGLVDSKEAEINLRRKLINGLTDRQSDFSLDLLFISEFIPDSREKTFNEVVEHQEAILLYREGEWFIPWREVGFKPELLEW